MLTIDREIAKFLAGLPADALRSTVERPGLSVSPMVAASLCGRSPRKINAALDSGTLPARLAGTHRHIEIAALARWADRGSFGAAEFARAFARIASDG